MRTRFLLAALWLAAAAGPARAAFNIPGFELVYTKPVETTLDQPDLRAPADVWVEMIDAAEKGIDVCEFYVTTKAGEPLEPVLAALDRAGRRGVKIRFLAEAKMAKTSAEGFQRLRAIPNLELRVLDFASVKKDGIIHAKYFVVDRAAAYLGSQNFDWRSLKHIHELGLRISKARIVRQLSAIFEADWLAQARVAAGKAAAPLNKARPASKRDQRAYLVASPWAFNPRGIGDSESELCRLIDGARQEVLIQLLDYAPLTRQGRFYPPIDNALRSAAARGVKVKLLVSHWNTEKPAVEHLKSLSLVPGVQVRIATLPQAAEGPIQFARVVHSKYMVVDGSTFWLGTSNWSGGYLDNSRNVELVIVDDGMAGKAAGLHQQLWNSPYTAPIDVAKDYPKPVR